MNSSISSVILRERSSDLKHLFISYFPNPGVVLQNDNEGVKNQVNIEKGKENGMVKSCEREILTTLEHDNQMN